MTRAQSPIVISRGQANELDKSLFTPQVIKTVRYADPAAWAVATAAARALAPVNEQVLLLKDSIGIIITSPHGPAETQAAIATAARDGTTSPLHDIF